jgi:hypothetical protein
MRAHICTNLIDQAVRDVGGGAPAPGGPAQARWPVGVAVAPTSTLLLQLLSCYARVDPISAAVKSSPDEP